LINNPRPTANAVVTEVTGNRATLWLGGFDADGLANLEDGTVLGSVAGRGNPGGMVRVRSRDGLVGIGTVEGVVAPGTLLRKIDRSVSLNN